MTEGQIEPAEPAEPSDAPAPGELSEPVEPREPSEPRPIIERIGLATIAVGAAVMFGGVGYAAWLGGELFLAVIGGISCVTTLWVGVLTLIRG